MSSLTFEPVHDGSLLSPVPPEIENRSQFPGILQNLVSEANMSQIVQEKQVSLGTSASLNALSQYVLRLSFSAVL